MTFFAELPAPFCQKRKLLPKTPPLCSLSAAIFKQLDGCGSSPPTIRPSAVVKRGGHTPVPENGLDHPRVGTEIRQFVSQSMAAAVQREARRNSPIPFEPENEGAEGFA
jgi:hypothetical protein